jgi:hypothetical protein
MSVIAKNQYFVNLRKRQQYTRSYSRYVTVSNFVYLSVNWICGCRFKVPTRVQRMPAGLVCPLAGVQGDAFMIIIRRTLYSCTSHARTARHVSSAHSKPVPPRGGLVVTSKVVVRA